MRFFQNLSQQIRLVWLGMSPTRRVVFVLLALICVATTVGVVYWASQPEYRVLYSELSVEDAGAVTAKLQSQGTSFRLAAGGTTILVPAEQLEQIRVDMATDGLPSKGGKGFELFDGNSLAMTPFQQHINYGRALQAELARTIMHLEPVAFARVHIAQPEASPFIRETKPVTASVVLKVKPGAVLSRNTAAGIVALVARSVEGLNPDQVTLLDTSGHVLFDQRGNDPTAVPGSQLEYKRDYEAYLASKAEDMLAQLLGQGRAVVRVTAEISFKNLTETRESYNLEQKPIKKESIQNHKTPTAGAGGAARGVTGPGGVGKNSAGASAGGNEVEETSDTEYYSPPKTIQQRVEGAGDVERLTVAAMVDRQSASAFTLADAEEIIKRAVGFKDSRDQIKVSDVKLPGPAAEGDAGTEITGEQRLQSYIAIAKSGSLGIVALVGLALGWMVLRRVVPAPASKTADNLKQDRSPKAHLISAAMERDPDAVTKVIANWLQEPSAQRKSAA
jgi:flagellar M-ring protein FliF